MAFNFQSFVLLFTFLSLKTKIKTNVKTLKSKKPRNLCFKVASTPLSDVDTFAVPNVCSRRDKTDANPLSEHKIGSVQCCDYPDLITFDVEMSVGSFNSVPRLMKPALVLKVASLNPVAFHSGPLFVSMELVKLSIDGFKTLIRTPSTLIDAFVSRVPSVFSSREPELTVHHRFANVFVEYFASCCAYTNLASRAICESSFGSVKILRDCLSQLSPKPLTVSAHSVPRSTIRTYSNRKRNNFLVVSSVCGILGSSTCGRLTTSPNPRKRIVVSPSGARFILFETDKVTVVKYGHAKSDALMSKRKRKIFDSKFARGDFKKNFSRYCRVAGKQLKKPTSAPKFNDTNDTVPNSITFGAFTVSIERYKDLGECIKGVVISESGDLKICEKPIAQLRDEKNGVLHDPSRPNVVPVGKVAPTPRGITSAQRVRASDDMRYVKQRGLQNRVGYSLGEELKSGGYRFFSSDFGSRGKYRPRVTEYSLAILKGDYRECYDKITSGLLRFDPRKGMSFKNVFKNNEGDTFYCSTVGKHTVELISVHHLKPRQSIRQFVPCNSVYSEVFRWHSQGKLPLNYLRRAVAPKGRCYFEHFLKLCVMYNVPFTINNFDAGRNIKKSKFTDMIAKNFGVGALKIPVHGFFSSKSMYHCTNLNTNFCPVTRLPQFIGGKDEDKVADVTDAMKHRTIERVFDRVGGRESLLNMSIEKDLITFKNEMHHFKKERQELVVPFRMTESIQNGLSRDYPQFNLKFTHSSYSDHPAAAASRLLENHTLSELCGGNFSDIGGCPLYHLKHPSRANIHVCRPVYDGKDAQRKVLRLPQLEKVAAGMSINELIEGPSRVSLCSKVLGKCAHKSRSLILVQVYDASLADICDAMILKESDVAYLTMITPGEILDGREAFNVDPLECEVNVDVHSDTLTYKFGASCYSHKLCTIRQIMTTPVYVSKGYLFSIENYERRFGVNYFKITKSSVCPSMSYTKTIRYKRAESDIIRVKLPRFDSKRKVCIPGVDYVYLDAKFVSRVYEYVVANCSVVNSKTFEWVWSFIKSSKSRVVISGKVIHKDVHLDLNFSESFAAVMLASGVKSRLASECLAKNLHYLCGDASFFDTLIFSINEKFISLMGSLTESLKALITKIMSYGCDLNFLQLNDAMEHVSEYAEVEVHVSEPGFGRLKDGEEEGEIIEVLRSTLEKATVSQAVGTLKSNNLNSKSAVFELSAKNKLNQNSNRNERPGIHGGSSGNANVFERIVAFVHSLTGITTNVFNIITDNVIRVICDNCFGKRFRSCLTHVCSVIRANSRTIFVPVTSVLKGFSKVLRSLFTLGERGCSSSNISSVVKNLISWILASGIKGGKKLFETTVGFLMSAIADVLPDFPKKYISNFRNALFTNWSQTVYDADYWAVASEHIVTVLTGACVAAVDSYSKDFNSFSFLFSFCSFVAVEFGVLTLFNTYCDSERSNREFFFRRSVANSVSTIMALPQLNTAAKILFCSGIVPNVLRRVTVTLFPDDKSLYKGYIQNELSDLVVVNSFCKIFGNRLQALFDTCFDRCASRLSQRARERVYHHVSSVRESVVDSVRNAFGKPYRAISDWCLGDAAEEDCSEESSVYEDALDDEYNVIPGLRGGSRSGRNLISIMWRWVLDHTTIENFIKVLGSFPFIKFSIAHCGISVNTSIALSSTCVPPYVWFPIYTFWNAKEFSEYFFSCAEERAKNQVDWLFDFYVFAGSALLTLSESRLRTGVESVFRGVAEKVNGVSEKFSEAVRVSSNRTSRYFHLVCNAYHHMLGLSLRRCCALILRGYVGTRLCVFRFKSMFGKIFESEPLGVADGDSATDECIQELFEAFDGLSDDVSTHSDFDFDATLCEVVSEELLKEINDRAGLFGGSRSSRSAVFMVLKFTLRLLISAFKTLAVNIDRIGTCDRLVFGTSSINLLLSIVAYIRNPLPCLLVDSLCAAKGLVRLIRFLGLSFSSIGKNNIASKFFSLALIIESVFESKVSVEANQLFEYFRENISRLRSFLTGGAKNEIRFKAVPVVGKSETRYRNSSVAAVYEQQDELVRELKNFISIQGTEAGISARIASDDTDNENDGGSQYADFELCFQPGESSSRANLTDDVKANQVIEKEIQQIDDTPDPNSWSSRFSVSMSPFLRLVNSSQTQPTPVVISENPFSNAVREFYYLQELTIFEVVLKLRNYYDSLSMSNFDRKRVDCDRDAGLYVYDEVTNIVSAKVGRVNLKEFKSHEFCFTSAGLVPNTPDLRCSRLYHDQTKFLAANSFLRSNNAYRLFESNYDRTETCLYEAPPGGGKTFTLVELFCEAYLKNKCLALTANKSSQVEILSKVNKKLSKLPVEENGESITADGAVLTIDSYLMNHKGKKCEILFVDECFMVHAGAVIAAIEYTLAKKCVLFGDSKQIHYVERNEFDSAFYSDLDPLINKESRVYGDISYRCPWDVCAWLSENYGHVIATTNVGSEGKKSMKVQEIEAVDDVQALPNYTYLTFLQSEKKDLEKHLAKKTGSYTVKTVHEAQGDTYPNVMLVRTKFQEDDPFRSFNHINVAITRHTESLTYAVLSARRDDQIASAIARSQELVDKFRTNPTSFGGSVLNISVTENVEDHSRCKASSAPINVINDFLNDVVPGSTTFDFGDMSAEVETQPFESGADNVTIRDTAKPGGGTEHDEQRV